VIYKVMGGYDIDLDRPIISMQMRGSELILMCHLIKGAQHGETNIFPIRGAQHAKVINIFDTNKIFWVGNYSKM